MTNAAVVLVHGAGHTSTVWDATRRHLRSPSIAVDIPGRRNRPADLCAVSIADATASVCTDIEATGHRDVVLVGHSIGGILLPSVAARLEGRVQHLVFVAGLCAPEGSSVIDVLQRDAVDETVARAAESRRRYRGHMFLPEDAERWTAIDDPKLAMALDSVNFITQPMSWRGVPSTLPRTFVRPTRDRIQPPPMQERLIRHCQASRVIDIDAGHTPAVAAPQQLAAILDDITTGRGGPDDEVRSPRP